MYFFKSTPVKDNAVLHMNRVKLCCMYREVATLKSLVLFTKSRTTMHIRHRAVNS